MFHITNKQTQYKLNIDRTANLCMKCFWMWEQQSVSTWGSACKNHNVGCRLKEADSTDDGSIRKTDAQMTTMEVIVQGDFWQLDNIVASTPATVFNSLKLSAVPWSSSTTTALQLITSLKTIETEFTFYKSSQNLFSHAENCLSNHPPLLPIEFCNLLLEIIFLNNFNSSKTLIAQRKLTNDQSIIPYPRLNLSFVRITTPLRALSPFFISASGKSSKPTSNYILINHRPELTNYTPPNHRTADYSQTRIHLHYLHW